jgi:hypothetical protein
MLLLPVVNTIITFAVKVPGCPRGYVGPGGGYLDGEAGRPGTSF